ncbi:cysteine dioxygenase [Vibrio sp. HA2012]|uniref:SufE family protein n=1 Tax=Vibrio sp. HA2012 TaxID=1971595 RepID=UPI000C2C0ED5|nr:SufE family protein [Vibrio sp. HA2012]PJC87719.1 cysteine dioxygenase [Vibrio sp. HA2012]
MTPEKVTKNFNRCSNWEEKYLYLIELGERFSTLPTTEQIHANQVQGCQSQVWLTLDYADGLIHINATSDAAIVRGLLALIIIAYNGQPAKQIDGFDLFAWFGEIELQEHLTPTRTIGLNAIITRTQALIRKNISPLP